MKKHLLILATALLSISTFAQIPTYVPANGLVGWWPFNGNANDESGNGNNGTVNGATLTTDRFGNANSAYDFDGVSNYIDCGPLNAIPSTVQDITQNAWVLAPTDQTTFCKLPIMSKRQVISEGWPSIGAGVNATDKAYYFVNAQNYSAGVTNMMLSNDFTNDGNWHMITGTKSGSNYKLYFDGVLQATYQDNYALTANSNLVIGYEAMWGFNCERWYSGKLDDIGIWNRALTACEIQDLYNAQLNSSNGVNAGLDQTVCEGNSVTLSGSGGSNYQWNNNVIDGVSFSPITSQDYILTGEDVNGCLGTDTVMIEVLSNSTGSATATECNSYTWSANGQTYTQSGQYTTMLTNAAGCDSTVTLDLTIETLSITAQPVDQLVVLGASAQFTVATSAVNPTYQWQLDNGTGWTNLSNAGQYNGVNTAVLSISNVQLNQDNFLYRCLVNAGNCSSTSSDARLNVEDNVGLEGLTKNGLQLYPNPASSSITLESQEILHADFCINDAQGKVVQRGRLQGNITAINIEELAKGSYTIVFEQKDLREIKFIKE